MLLSICRTGYHMVLGHTRLVVVLLNRSEYNLLQLHLRDFKFVGLNEVLLDSFEILIASSLRTRHNVSIRMMRKRENM
jgi:hypothetical protein